MGRESSTLPGKGRLAVALGLVIPASHPASWCSPCGIAGRTPGLARRLAPPAALLPASWFLGPA
eukprot:11520730-Heterocapsa_arctica.AAC.1